MLKDILDELKILLKGQTLDAMIPVVLFSLLNQNIALEQSVLIALSSSFLITVFRFLKKQKYQYALLGTLFLAFASIMSLSAQNASNFYLPNILTHAVLLIASMLSLIIQKPLSIYVSHLSRGWTLKWYFRADIYPAYKKVTLVWIFLFAFSFALQTFTYFYLDASAMAWIAQIFSLPFTLLVLIITYVYGLYELRKLHGPGIDEFMQNKPAPYKGQTRGF